MNLKPRQSETLPHSSERNVSTRIVTGFLYLVGFLMLGSFLVAPAWTQTANGQDTSSSSSDCKGTSYEELEKCRPMSPGRIFSKINSALSVGGKDWGDVFGTDDPKKIGKDLYAYLYHSTIIQPEIKAAKNITGKYGTTEAEMAQILNGDFSSILKRKPNISQEEAIAKMSEIQNKFQEEKDYLQLQAEISSAVQPNEIFANGDITDSEFDLINDLDMIEKMLFLKAAPIDVGGEFIPDSVPDETDGQPDSSGTGKTSSSDADTQGNATDSGSETEQGNQGNGQNSGSQPSPDGGIDPNQCLVPGSLDDALSQYDGKNSGASSKNPSGKDSGGAAAGSPTDATNPDDPLPEIEKATPKVQAAPADNWLFDAPCTDVFCLQIKFVQKSPSLYKVSDNCIDCHIEKINEKLKETINHSLIPSKATGNLLEPNLCKKAAATSLTAIGMNFYAISKPVATPQNDDLIYGVSVSEEWKKFVQTYKPFAFDELNKNDPSNQKTKQFPVSEEERATTAALLMAPPTATYQEITAKVNQQIETVAQERQEAVRVATASLQSDVDAAFYQGIQREMDQMNAFFELFQKILTSLHEKVDGVTGSQACGTINDISACS